MDAFKKIKFLLTFLLLTLCGSTLAAKSVFDSRNYGQNHRTAIESVKIEANTAETMRQQIRATLDAAKSVATYGDMLDLAEVQKEYELYKQLKIVDEDMMQTLTKSQQLNDNLYHSWAAGDQNFEDFLATRAELDRDSDKALNRQFQTMNSELESVAARRKNVVQRLHDATGQTQALQAVGAAIDVLIGQNQQLISALTAQGQAAAVQKQTAEASRKRAQYDAAEFHRRQREAANRDF